MVSLWHRSQPGNGFTLPAESKDSNTFRFPPRSFCKLCMLVMFIPTASHSFFMCSLAHFLLTFDFGFSPCWQIFSFSHSLSTAAFASRIFIAWGIGIGISLCTRLCVMTQRIELFLGHVIFMIFVFTLWYACSCRFVSHAYAWENSFVFLFVVFALCQISSQTTCIPVNVFHSILRTG